MLTINKDFVTNYLNWSRRYPLRDEVNRLPEVSGIYIIGIGEDAKYVGQSENLKNRCKDYRCLSTDNQDLKYLLVQFPCWISYLPFDTLLLREAERVVILDLKLKGYDLVNISEMPTISSLLSSFRR